MRAWCWALLTGAQAVAALREGDEEAIRARLEALQAFAHHHDAEAVQIAREHGVELNGSWPGELGKPEGAIRTPAAPEGDTASIRVLADPPAAKSSIRAPEFSIRAPAESHTADVQADASIRSPADRPAANASIRAPGADAAPSAPAARARIRDGAPRAARGGTLQAAIRGGHYVTEPGGADFAVGADGAVSGPEQAAALEVAVERQVEARMVDELAREVQGEVDALYKRVEAEDHGGLQRAKEALERAEQQAAYRWQQNRLFVLGALCFSGLVGCLKLCLKKLGLLADPPPALLAVHSVQLEACLPTSTYVVCAAEKPVRAGTYAALKRAAGAAPRAVEGGSGHWLSASLTPVQLLLFRAPTALEQDAKGQVAARGTFLDKPERGAGETPGRAVSKLGPDYLAVGLCDVEVDEDGPVDEVHEVVVRDPQGWNVAKLKVSLFRAPSPAVLALGFGKHAPAPFLRAVQHSFQLAQAQGPADRRAVLATLLTCELVVDPGGRSQPCSFEVTQRRSGRWFWMWYGSKAKTHALGQLPICAVRSVFAEENRLKVVYAGVGTQGTSRDHVLELQRGPGDWLRDGQTVALALELLRDTLLAHRGPWLDLTARSPASAYAAEDGDAVVPRRTSKDAFAGRGSKAKPVVL